MNCRVCEKNNLHFVDSFWNKATKVNVMSGNQLQIKEKWYRILGHINF